MYVVEVLLRVPPTGKGYSDPAARPTHLSGGCHAQEEFQFYYEDANSKLVLVPAKGNGNAEDAAKACKVPVASLAVELGPGPSPMLNLHDHLSMSMLCKPTHLQLAPALQCSHQHKQ